jgi:hypothetical protein
MTPEYYLSQIDLRAMAKPDFSTLFVDPEVFNNLALDLSRPFLVLNTVKEQACQ